MGEVPKRQIRSDEPPRGMMVRPLLSAHLESVVAIAKESFPLVWAPKEFLYFLEHPCQLNVGLFSPTNGELGAYFLGLLVKGELDIISIATKASHRRQGFAEQLLRAVIQIQSVERAFLEVNANNTSAISLYQKCGFQIQGIRKKYYEQRDDALLMRWVRSKP